MIDGESIEGDICLQIIAVEKNAVGYLNIQLSDTINKTRLFGTRFKNSSILPLYAVIRINKLVLGSINKSITNIPEK